MSPESPKTPQLILETQGLAKSFLGLQALQDFSTGIHANEILGLIGPNGAGKTTCFNLLTGFLVPTAGKIYFKGEDITGRRPAQIARLGLARTFQNIRVFNTLSVLENVMTAAQLRTPFSLGETLFSSPSFRHKEAEVQSRARDLLDLLHLSEHANQPAASLPYANQRRLEIARALATEPSLLLLDEPAAGMNPAESDRLHQLILDLRARFHLTILLVEHDMRLVMNLCERIIVLNYGKIITEGKPETVRRNRQVIAAYLGEDQSQIGYSRA